MYDVSALGELLMDFSPAGVSENGDPLYESSAGGAPVNVAVCVCRLGGTAAYIGKVGKDPFGEALKKAAASMGVDVRGVKTTRYYPTALSFAAIAENGGRSVHYYHANTADMRLTPAEVDTGIIDESLAFCYGSFSLVTEPACAATFAAAAHAKKQGKLVCYDPNLRLSLWENERVARDSILRGMQYATVLKISEGEQRLLTNNMALREGTRKLLRDHNLSAVVVTRGALGAYCATFSFEASVPAYAIRVVDTVGAGDAFTGGFLYRVLSLDKPVDRLSLAELMVCLDFASAVGSMATAKRGAWNALPTLEEVYDCMRSTPKIV